MEKRYFRNTEMTMMKGATSMQMMGFGITDGNTLIIVDGGTPGDTEKLKAYIKSKGGTVDAWLVTHGHYDHVGALTEILKEDCGIGIKRIYVDLFDLDSVKDTLVQMEQDCYRMFVELLKESYKGEIIKPELFRIYDEGAYKVEILKEKGTFLTDNFNDTGIVYKLHTETEPVLFLGDLGEKAGDYILDTYNDYDLQKFRTGICQLAHHGQNGVKECFYALIEPKTALWPTPLWLYQNDAGKGYGTGPFHTFDTIKWMKKLKTTDIFIFDEDAVIR